MFSLKPKRRIWRILICVFLVLGLIIGACGLYLADYYKADEAAIEAFLTDRGRTEGKFTVMGPDNAEAGFIFYPGGKVEHTAYLPLMQACAEQGILCVLVEMPYRLAVLDIDAAGEIPQKYPQVQRWYIGGHSLGGSMAASYLSDHMDDFNGLVLLGAYSTADLSNGKIDVLSIYGSEDRVMNRKKYESNQANLPSDFSQVIIEGGCHAYFGMYGHQDGDGTPTISNEEQILLTAKEIGNMINKPRSVN